MNKVVLIGRLTKDPELKFAPNTGTAIARFTVAASRRKKDDGADFISCVAFGKTGETICQYLVKGNPIALTGHMQTGSYDAKDGTKRYTTDVIVETFEFIGSGQAKSDNSDVDDIEPVDDIDTPF